MEVEVEGRGSTIRRLGVWDWDDIFPSDDDEPPVWEDGWDHEPPTATTAPHGAKRARREEAGSSCARVRPYGAAPAPALTVDDPDALNCGVCFLPLRAPIFQCEVGHMLCSVCCNKLQARGKCYMCGIPIPESGYSRCHGMEHLVECIHVQCPNAAHGCTTRPTYYDQNSHFQTCPHAPCHCPGKACSFIGSPVVLLDHIAGVHGWPCTTIKTGCQCTVDLHEGFNFLLASCEAAGSEASNQLLFLLNVAQQPLDCVISMVCINSHGNGDAKVIQCNLSFSNYRGSINDLYGGAQVLSHHQSSTFRVACTDFSGGLPDLDKCFRFVVPNSVTRDNKECAIQVKACIMILNSN